MDNYNAFEEKEKTRNRVKFNEEELDEYDKQRGQKMKILEPKTPFEFSDQEKQEEVRVENQRKIDDFNARLEQEMIR
jgi:hypothetical protein